MIEFLSPDDRLRFHLLPLDVQQEWESMALALKHTGQKITVLYVDPGPPSEVSVRIGSQDD